MEKEEINIDEMFDLKPIVPEIYSSHHHHHHPFSINGSFNPPPSSPQLISFENSKSSSTDRILDYNTSGVEMAKDSLSLPLEIINFSSNSDSGDSTSGNIRVSSVTRSPSQAHEHLIAERKRRENLSQLFINLSKAVPGLKKLDKGSLLEDGINYLKALQDRVRVLEEEEMKQGAILDTSKDDLYKERSPGDDGGSEIQARISDKQVLVKIFCKKQMEMMSRIPGEMEKINLSVIDMRIMPFGGAALDITILAEMQSGFKGTVKDIVDHLHTSFLNPCHNIIKDNL